MYITLYEKKYKEQWDLFVEHSKNATFLLKRDYMEYHQDRFSDTSFLIFDEKENILCLIAGTISENMYYTHKGLTYGGFILDRSSKINDVMSYFEILNFKLKELGVEKVIYKMIPYIYHSYPSDEDQYALFRLHAKEKIVNISSTICLQEDLQFNKSRKSCISKSKRYNLEIVEDKYFVEFWEIMIENLEKTHNAKPVHTVEEILYLKKLFPENIKLYVSLFEGKPIAGTLLYEEKNVAHVQYISANGEGKEKSALDFIFNDLIKEKYKNKKYFDFGTSTEKEGRHLNDGLIFQKEGFGARGICYKVYEYDL